MSAAALPRGERLQGEQEALRAGSVKCLSSTPNCIYEAQSDLPTKFLRATLREAVAESIRFPYYM